MRRPLPTLATLIVFSLVAGPALAGPRFGPKRPIVIPRPAPDQDRGHFQAITPTPQEPGERVVVPGPVSSRLDKLRQAFDRGGKTEQRTSRIERLRQAFQRTEAVSGVQQFVRPNPLFWNWTVDRSYDLYWEGGQRAGVPLPWNDDGPCFDLEPDNRKQDGWVLLAKDFGSADAPIESLPDLPFFALYNRYTGMICLYIYNGERPGTCGSQNTNYSVGILSIVSSGIGKIPAFSHHTGTRAATVDRNYRQMFITEDLVTNEWTRHEFDVRGYDRNIRALSKRNAYFLFELHSLQESEVELAGTLSLSGFINAGDLRSGYRGNGSVDTVGSGTAASLKVAQVFNDANAVRGKMAGYASENPGRWWSDPLSNLAHSGVGSVISALSPAAGFITSFFGGGGGSSVPLSWRVDLTGDLQLSGTIRTTQPVSRHMIYVPGTRHGDDPAIKTPVYDAPLGLFDLRSGPKVGAYRRHDIRRPWGISVVDLPLDFNERCGLEIVSTKVAFVSPHYAPTSFFNLSSFSPSSSDISPNSALWISNQRWNSLRLGLLMKFKPVGASSDRIMTMYREYPILNQDKEVILELPDSDQHFE